MSIEKQLVHVGDVMITFTTESIDTPATPSPGKLPARSSIQHATTVIATNSKVRSSPSVRKVARTMKLGIDITTLEWQWF